MEFSNREHVAKVWRSAVGNGELVDGDTMILQIVDLVEAWFVGGFHYLFFPDTLNGFGIWVVWGGIGPPQKNKRGPAYLLVK